MTEKEKMLAGLLYNAEEENLVKERTESKMLCYEYNNSLPNEQDKRIKILKELIGEMGENVVIEPSFKCDYGYNIKLGKNFFANYNLIILDTAPVIFGDNVFIGPNCSFYPPQHPLDAKTRNTLVEYAKPITVGNNVWLGGNVTVLGGVSIGDNCVIGAGSVVTKDIPANSVAVGNPCKVVKVLSE